CGVPGLRAASRNLADGGLFDLHLISRLAVAFWGGVVDLVQGGQTLVADLAEDVVRRRQRGVLRDEEELRAVGVRAGIRHCQGATRVGQRGLALALGHTVERELVAELVARSTRALAGRVAALQDAHLVGLHVAVADRVIEVVLLGQGFEAVYGARGGTAVQLNWNLAGGCLQVHLDQAIRRDILGAWLIDLLGGTAFVLVLTADLLRVGLHWAGRQWRVLLIVLDLGFCLLLRIR